MQPDIAIRFDNLSKTFGNRNKPVYAVRKLNLEIEAGQVFGFLGPNGAGKSTTIRMLLDLIRPTAGRAFLYGQPVDFRSGVLARVGALVEGAQFYDFMNGRDNLAALARTAGRYDANHINLLLDQVGLTDRAGRRVGTYSTGMKQRLGIAAALLGDPDLLILDEPTNGLDPAGIQEMRKFIRSLTDDQGKTVFLSSHLLAEVEQVCDQVAIIHRGELLRAGRVNDLLQASQGELRLEVGEPHRACQILSSNWTLLDAPPDQAAPPQRDWLTLAAHADESPHIVRALAAAGIDVFQVVVRRQSLEEFFMAVTNQSQEVNNG